MVRGFTMIEVLAIVAVIGIMLLVSLVNYNPAKNDAKLKAAQREVASAIQTAKSYALQGKTVDISGNMQVPKYWGFKFTSATAYVIFYNNTDGAPSGNDSTVESYSLNNGIRVKNPASLADTRITNKVPNASVILATGSSDMSIELEIQGVIPTKTVRVTPGGVVTEN